MSISAAIRTNNCARHFFVPKDSVEANWSGSRPFLNLMVEFTDVTSQELNRVITNMLLDYVATAVKQIDVLDWVKETDKPLRKP
jgi:hypothetical protein